MTGAAANAGTVADGAPAIFSLIGPLERIAALGTESAALDASAAAALLAALAAPGQAADLRELLDLAAERTRAAAGADDGVVLLLEGEALVPAARARGGPTSSASGPWDGEALDDAARDAARRAIPERRAAVVGLPGGRRALVVPLIVKGAPLGAVVATGRALSPSCRDTHLPLFTALGRQVALAIEHARLRARVALEDGLGDRSS